MSDLIAQLLKRNISEVFDEHDAGRRRAAIADLFTEDCVFTGPAGRHVGYAALDHAVAALHGRFQGFRFSALGAPQIVQDAGRIAWAYGPPEDASHITGLDMIVTQGAKIAALYTFLDPSSS
jgi:hypothetical protein